MLSGKGKVTWLEKPCHWTDFVLLTNVIQDTALEKQSFLHPLNTTWHVSI